MKDILREREGYLKRKLSHLLFEILEYPAKREVLYLALCYCQLSRAWGADEIPLSELKRCLNRYLIDFDSYRWRDYLLELELFYMRDSGDQLVKGAALMVYTPTDNTAISIDPRYGFLKHRFCQRVYRYWYLSRRWENFTGPRSGWEVIDNAVRLFNEGLYGESALYLDDYLPYLNGESQLLLYRLLRGLAHLGEALEEEDIPLARREIGQLKDFLKEFKKELKGVPYDVKKLSKDLKRLEKRLQHPRRSFYSEPLKVERKKKGSLMGFIKKFFRGLLIFP